MPDNSTYPSSDFSFQMIEEKGIQSAREWGPSGGERVKSMGESDCNLV